jgi:hypothetical protein
MVKIQTLEEIRSARDHRVEMPPRERYGERVPHGGTMCANCEYLIDRENRICRNENFIAWNGSNRIPGEIDAYCSIWWENGTK